MKRNPLLALVLATVASTFALADDKTKPKDFGVPADLIGGYTIISGEKYGEKEPTERIEGVTVRIAEDAIIVLDKDKKEAYAQTYKIDTTSTPWKITLKSKITPYKQANGKDSEEMIAQGLIQKDGDSVKLIYALPGTPAPTEFKTKSKQLMFVMKNEKKEKKADRDDR